MKQYTNVKRRSDKFKESQRLSADSLFTVLTSVDPLSWDRALCLCDTQYGGCGREMELTYQQLYRRQYSCGCKRKILAKEEDHVGYKAWGKGNGREEWRYLEVLGRDEKTQRWLYICSCCAEVFSLARGNARGVQSALQHLAMLQCPNYLQFYAYEDRIGFNSIVQLMNLIGHPRYRGVEEFAECRYEPEHVARNLRGEIVGFYGLPRSLPGDNAINGDWLPASKSEAPPLPCAEVPIAIDINGLDGVELNNWPIPSLPYKSIVDGADDADQIDERGYLTLPSRQPPQEGKRKRHRRVVVEPTT